MTVKKYIIEDVDGDFHISLSIINYYHGGKKKHAGEIVEKMERREKKLVARIEKILLQMNKESQKIKNSTKGDKPSNMIFSFANGSWEMNKK